MNVTAIQMSAEIANKEANFNKVKEIAKRDIKGSTDVIVLPEVWSVGWSPKHFRENAEEISTSQTIEFLSDIARDYKSWVIGGSFITKINNIFAKDIEKLFENTDIYNCDFEDLLLNKLKLTENDFIFLDPPYDTEFSDYEGKNFDKSDQVRLAECLKKISAKFILIIKNTDFIYSLYKDHFRILSFDKNYTYNVRSRNDRNVEHLIITNIPE